MNSILNRGFVSPYIEFHFAAGTIDTLPPRYFASFQQNRSVDKSCSFTLTLIYAPENFDDDTAMIIDRFLLSSVKKDVSYRYGYKTAHGGLSLQNRCYKGIFTTYNEDIQEGYLVYTISGFAKSIELTSPTVCVSDYINRLKGIIDRRKPSYIVKDLIYGNGIAANTGISDYFKNYEIFIDHTDETVLTSSVNIQDGPLHDVFFGTAKSDGSTLPNGLVSLSYREYTPQSILDNQLLPKEVITRASEYSLRLRYNSSGMSDSEIAVGESAQNALKNLKKMPFICFYDNAVSSIDSGSHGSFYYVEKYTRQPTNIFRYNFGNNFIDSDVLSFNVSYDSSKAVASVPSLQEVTADIDAGGEAIGSNYNNMRADGFVENTYSTPSGFNESAFISTTTMASAMIFPFEATMTVVGQTDCNRLMDCVRVLVYVNGKEHLAMSGDYTILGIEDELSENGFTTTFKLIKSDWAINNDKLPEYATNYKSGNRVWYNQQACADDYL